MYRIDSDGSVNGAFTDGNPQIGQEGTVLEAEWLNDMQEVVAQAIEHSGQALSRSDHTQLWKAIIAIATGVAGGGAGAGSVPTSREVLGGGLVSGGGPLSGDLTLSVAKAAAADVLAGTRDDMAVTPQGLANVFGNSPGVSSQIRFPGGGAILQFGTVSGVSSEGTFTGTFVPSFPNACDHVFLTVLNPTASISHDIWAQLVSKSKDGFVGMYQWINAGGSGNVIDGCDFFAIGH